MENKNLEFALPDEKSYSEISNVEPVRVSNRKKSTAILLAFFGGCMGVHSFYLGFTKKGVIQLFSSILGISLLWALIDIFRMLFSSEVYDADGNILS